MVAEQAIRGMQLTLMERWWDSGVFYIDFPTYTLIYNTFLVKMICAIYFKLAIVKLGY